MKLVIGSLALAVFTGLAQAQPTPEAPPASAAQARHFEASVEALAKKGYDLAAAEIRQGEALVERAAACAEHALSLHHREQSGQASPFDVGA
jgi:hypothetical protein